MRAANAVGQAGTTDHAQQRSLDQSGIWFLLLFLLVLMSAGRRSIAENFAAWLKIPVWRGECGIQHIWLYYTVQKWRAHAAYMEFLCMTLPIRMVYIVIGRLFAGVLNNPRGPSRPRSIDHA